MRLLVPTRICLALRWATTPAASRVVTRAPKQGNKAAASTKEKPAQHDAPSTPTPKQSTKAAAAVRDKPAQHDAPSVTPTPRKKNKKKKAAAHREKTALQDAPPAADANVAPTPRLINKEAAARREATGLRNALAYLDAGKNEEFRAQWKGKLSDNVTLHNALLKSAESGKSDPAMLRWYAESLVVEQRTPFQTNFESMMVPVIRALDGKIEKWKEDDKRRENLRKWRDDYSDESLKEVLESMIKFFDSGFYKKYFPAGNLSVFKNALSRVEDDGDKRAVFVDWSDIVHNGATKSLNFDDLLPGFSTVQVARVADAKTLQFCDFELLRTPHGRAHRDKHPFMKDPSEVERTRKLDGLCTLMLAIASRGHWLSNAVVRDDAWGLQQYLKKESSSQVNLLKNFAYDSVLRYSSSGVVQPAVDHSKAPQFIDQDKKELAFTVARDLEELPPNHPYKSIEYYSIHLD